MATVAVRSALRLTRPSIMVCYRGYADKMMADPVEHATGIEKRELLARLAGNDNPFDLRVYKRGPGSKDKPNMIPSIFPKRMIGCICEEDSTVVNYMWLHMGEPKRCECGHWFKLVEGKAV